MSKSDTGNVDSPIVEAFDRGESIGSSFESIVNVVRAAAKFRSGLSKSNQADAQIAVDSPVSVEDAANNKAIDDYSKTREDIDNKFKESYPKPSDQQIPLGLVQQADKMGTQLTPELEKIIRSPSSDEFGQADEAAYHPYKVAQNNNAEKVFFTKYFAEPSQENLTQYAICVSESNNIGGQNVNQVQAQLKKSFATNLKESIADPQQVAANMEKFSEIFKEAAKDQSQATPEENSQKQEAERNTIINAQRSEAAKGAAAEVKNNPRTNRRLPEVRNDVGPPRRNAVSHASRYSQEKSNAVDSHAPKTQDRPPKAHEEILQRGPKGERDGGFAREVRRGQERSTAAQNAGR